MSTSIARSRVVVTLLLSTSLGLAACARPYRPAPPRNFDQDVKGNERLEPGEYDPDKVENWFTKGPEQGVEGVNAEALYADAPEFKREIVVAVIDSGVDIDHEDLQGRIWTNAVEAAGKPGVDDDGNGYIDDVHGWNYLGSIRPDGTYVHLEGETLETVREKVRLQKKKAELESKGLKLPADEEKLLATLTTELDEARKAALKMLGDSQAALDKLKPHYAVLAQKLGVPFSEVTEQALKDLTVETDAEKAARDGMLAVLQAAKVKVVSRFERRVTAAKDSLNINLNESLDARETLVGDDPLDFSDIDYGNPDVKGLNPDHGTHVAGIIAAVRDNGIGVQGIAQNVKIMALRVVPNGDERDKDIARSVRYAVDNGANIINMSFGKKLSPNKKEVDDAFLYAASKGVLIFHAAGNDSQNTDEGAFFPNRYVRGALGDSFLDISTWVEIGASARYKDSRLPAVFSNYGQNAVDVFAPGFELLSSVPGNKYAVYSGTSMACPSAAGTAALLWSTHPELKAADVRRVLLQGARSHASLQVLRPGAKDDKDLLPFGALSRTGGVLDILQALELLP